MTKISMVSWIRELRTYEELYFSDYRSCFKLN